MEIHVSMPAFNEVHKILAKGMYDMAKPSKDLGEEYFLRPGVVCHYLLQVS